MSYFAHPQLSAILSASPSADREMPALAPDSGPGRCALQGTDTQTEDGDEPIGLQCRRCRTDLYRQKSRAPREKWHDGRGLCRVCWRSLRRSGHLSDYPRISWGDVPVRLRRSEWRAERKQRAQAVAEAASLSSPTDTGPPAAPVGTPSPAERCICEGKYEGCAHGQGSCPHPADTPPWVSLCAGCEERRGEHLDLALADALADMERQEVNR